MLALSQIEDITSKMADTVFKQPQKIDIHIRNASFEEQTILTGKSSFPSRRSSIGIKVMSKFGLSQESSPEYIAELKEDNNIDALILAMDSLMGNFELSEDYRVQCNQLKTTYMELLSCIETLQSSVSKMDEKTANEQMIETKTLAATRDFDILVEEKQRENSSIIKQASQLEMEIDGMLEKEKEMTEFCQEQGNVSNDISKNNNTIVTLKSVIESSQKQLEQARHQTSQLKQKRKYSPKETDSLRQKLQGLQEEMKFLEEETLHYIEVNPQLLKLKNSIDELDENIVNVSEDCERSKSQAKKWKKYTMKMVHHHALNNIAVVPLKILLEHHNEMYWEELKDLCQKHIDHTKGVEVLYELVAKKVITLDRSQSKAIAQLML